MKSAQTMSQMWYYKPKRVLAISQVAANRDPSSSTPTITTKKNGWKKSHLKTQIWKKLKSTWSPEKNGSSSSKTNLEQNIKSTAISVQKNKAGTNGKWTSWESSGTGSIWKHKSKFTQIQILFPIDR